MLKDVRYALRQLRRTPGFAVMVVATLALGIGATTVVFSIVDAVLLRPLPFPHADRLVEISNLETVPGGATKVNETSYPNFFDWREQSKSFSSMASYKANGYSLASAGAGTAERLNGVMVSADFFSTIGVQPMLGRGFKRDEEQQPVAAAVWRSQRRAGEDDSAERRGVFDYRRDAPRLRISSLCERCAALGDAGAGRRGRGRFSQAARV
jgi:hypothetical protein